MLWLITLINIIVRGRERERVRVVFGIISVMTGTGSLLISDRDEQWCLIVQIWTAMICIIVILLSLVFCSLVLTGWGCVWIKFKHLFVLQCIDFYNIYMAHVKFELLFISLWARFPWISNIVLCWLEFCIGLDYLCGKYMDFSHCGFFLGTFFIWLMV